MELKTGFKSYIHPNWGCSVDLNNVIDVSPYFLQRDISNKRNSGLYFIYDWFQNIVYIGIGVTILNTTWKEILSTCRALNHKQNKRNTELVAKYLNSEYTIRIVASGLTNLEAHLLEAYFIRLELKNGRKLTTIGATKWDGYSLMNKNRGMSNDNFNKWSKLYLNDVYLKKL